MFYFGFSAGVGRTGAYIMIDALLEQAEKENCVDALSLLHSLREDRPNMVQTEVMCQFIDQSVTPLREMNQSDSQTVI